MVELIARTLCLTLLVYLPCIYTLLIFCKSSPQFAVVVRMCVTQFANHVCVLTPSSKSLAVVACKTMATSACPDQTVKDVTYEEMQNLIKGNSAIIIDVRQPDELLEGTIPSSFNVPLGEVEQALRDLTDEQFKAKYGHSKPQPSDRLVFSCRAGGRAHQATQTALLLGYCNSFNYKGSWTEWEKRSKK